MKISLCVITKNEEKNIATCINSVKTVVDEIIVVDTGSTDATVRIVEGLGGKVYCFEWIQDFAAARNYALSKASGEWIIFLDADEYICKQSISALRLIIQKADELNFDVIDVELININQVTQAFQSSIPCTRILKKNPLLSYKGKIHETIYKLKGDIKRLDSVKEIKIFHIGYSTDIVREKKKSERNIKLLYKELDKSPSSSNIHFYLAEAFNLVEDKEKTLHHAREVFKYHNGDLNGIYQKSYFYQLKCMIDLSHDESEIWDSYNQAVDFEITYPDYEVLIGNYLIAKKEYREAVIHFIKCIEKVNTYQGTSESWISTNVKEVFEVVADLYYLLREYEECVKYLVYILNVYKEDEESLMKLIRILKEKNSLQEVFSIINKIYDIRTEQDKLIVLRACVALKDYEVSCFIKELLGS